VPNPLGTLSRAGSARCLFVLLPLLVCAPNPVFGAPLPKAVQDRAKHPSAPSDKPAHTDKTAYDYDLPGSDGKSVPLADFKGKYLLVVNLARNSSYNAQLPALAKLSDNYRAKGLVVIGVPSNDFGASEPGTGEEEIPFYLYLTKSKSAPPGGDVHWNFTKFIIDKNGKVIARLNPDVAPDSPETLSTLDEILDGTFKPKKQSDKKAADSSDDSDDDQ
jgi:glutathione peroxidase